jgi:mono/diheme cytochrome c family protein
MALMPCFMASPQDGQASQDAAYIEKGRNLFRQHCAACHGIEARGNGPAAAQLKKQPADLTVVQKRGEGFPIYKVLTFIDGEKVVPAHGTREMPIWGKVFRRTEGEAAKQSDIYALAKYIEAIQRYRQ